MITIWATPMWIYIAKCDKIFLQMITIWATSIWIYSQMWLNFLMDDYHLSNTHDPQQDLTKIWLQAKYESKKI